jgi:hypothetical protein
MENFVFSSKLRVLLGKHCVANNMGTHSSPNTEPVTLLEQGTRDIVGAESLVVLTASPIAAKGVLSISDTR